MILYYSNSSITTLITTKYPRFSKYSPQFADTLIRLINPLNPQSAQSANSPEYLILSPAGYKFQFSIL